MSNTFTLGSRVIDLDFQVVRHEGEETQLTGQESALLRYLSEAGGEPVPREDLLRDVLGYRGANTRALDTAVRRVRSKIEEDPAQPAHLLTLYGQGYRLVGAVEKAERQPPRPEPVVLPALPADRTAFVGRQKEVQSVLSAVRSPGLVTILGPGGMGKTRLAIEVARRAGEARFVDCAPCRTGPELRNHLAAELQLDPGVDNFGAVLTKHLADLGLGLLVLDNLEQVVEGAAALIDDMLVQEGAPGLLCTSRHALRLAGERVVNLGPMSTTDAVAVLCSAAARRGISLSADNPQAAELVERLDRMPLALELAAGRLGALGIEGLLESVQANQLQLSTRERGALERHASLGHALDWSWELLEDEDRVALARLSVLPGPFGPERAAALLEDDSGVGEALARLTERSWIARDPDQPVFRMLIVVREYVESEQREERERACDLLASELVGELRTSSILAIQRGQRPDTTARMAALSAELDLALGAIEPNDPRREALQVARTFVYRALGPARAGRAFADGALAAVQSPAGRARLLSDLAFLCLSSGDAAAALERSEEREAWEEEHGIALTEPGASAKVLWQTGQGEKAIAAWQAELEQQREDRSDDLYRLASLALLATLAGDADAGEAWLERAERLPPEARTRTGEFALTSARGRLAMRAGRFRIAREEYRRSVALMRAMGNEAFVMTSLAAQVTPNLLLGHLEEARQQNDSVAQLARRWGHITWVRTAQLLEARILHREGRLDEASEATRALLDRQILPADIAVYADMVHGEGLLLGLQLPDAQAHAEMALERAQRLGHAVLTGHAAALLLEIQAESGATEPDVALCDAVAAVDEALPSMMELRARAICCWNGEAPDEAKRWAKKADERVPGMPLTRLLAQGTAPDPGLWGGLVRTPRLQRWLDQ